MPTAEIPAQAMNLILEEFEILAKVDDGRLSTIIAFETPTRPGRYSNCISRILKHYTLNGKHLATTHCITDLGGQDRHRHRHGKDFRIQEVCLWTHEQH